MQGVWIYEHICSAIGYSATRILEDDYGGAALYVPTKASATHPLCSSIGLPQLQALVRKFGGEVLRLPANSEAYRTARERRIAAMIEQGVSIGEIAEAVGLTEVQCNSIRRKLEASGRIPKILRARPAALEACDNHDAATTPGAPQTPMHEGTESPEFRVAGGAGKRETPLTALSWKPSDARETPGK